MIRLVIGILALLIPLVGALRADSAAARTARIDCNTDSVISVELKAELGKLATGLVVPLSVAETCELSVMGQPDLLPLDSARVQATLISPGLDEAFNYDTVIEDKWGRENPDAQPGAHLMAGAGQFQLWIGLVYTASPSPPVPKSSAKDQYTFVVQAQGRPHDERVKPLVRWLAEAKLDKYFSVLSSCDLRTADPSCAWARTLAAKVGHYRSGRPGQAFEIDENLEVALPGDTQALRAAKIPLVVIELRPELERFSLDNLLENFEKKTGMSIWDKALAKAAAGYGLSTTDFAIVANVSCHTRLVYRLPNGQIDADGLICMSASASTFLGAYNRSVVSQAASTPIGAVDLPRLVNVLINREFAPAGGKWTALDVNDDYVEGIVRGIKGVVVRGGRSRERLRLSFVLTKTANRATLRVIGDGNTAHGLGAYPPDSQFTEDIEIRNGRALSDYVKCLANLAKNLAAGVQTGGCH